MVSPVFKKRVKEIHQLVSSVPISIVIWGPGEGADNPIREKRLKLRESLSEEFGEENVIFPEDKDPDFEKWRARWGDYAKEFYEVQAADVIIVIGESIGAIVEISLYRREIAGKSIIFVERRVEGQKGFAGHAYAPLKYEEVEPEEWKSCERIRKLSHEFVENLRIDKFRKLQNGVT
jgi:hypothetical protein